MAKIQTDFRILVVVMGAALATGACRSGSSDQSALSGEAAKDARTKSEAAGRPRPEAPLPDDPAWKMAQSGDIGLVRLAEREGAVALFSASRGEGEGARIALEALPFAPDANQVLWQLCADVRKNEPSTFARLAALHRIVVDSPHDVESADALAERRCHEHLGVIANTEDASARDLALSSAAMLHERARR